MPLMTWYKSYSINNDELDRHHMTLFGIFNSLHDICTGEEKLFTMKNIFEELVLYSNYHFEAEEQYMSDIGYSGINKHIAEHIIFKEKIKELQDKINYNSPESCHELVTFLSNWLLNHVIQEDKKIAA